MNEKPLKREQARLLYVNKLLPAATISRRLKVTPKTVGVWVKLYNWKTARDEFIKSKVEKQQALIIPIKTLTLFFDYLKTQDKGLAKKVEPILTNYTKIL